MGAYSTKEFGRRVRKAMDARRIGIKELAHRAAASEKSVYKWASGHGDPTAQKLCSLCDAMDVSADYLLGRKDEMR